jgi:N-acetylglucosamine-6-sulfatase
VAIAELGCRLASRRRPREAPRGGRRAGWALAAAILLGPVCVAASIPVFLAGYRAIFQGDLLPPPGPLPGPLPEHAIPAAPDAALRPNMLVILSDDHRSDFAGYAGHPFVSTPSLDRIAAEGVRFDRAYVTSSLCSPSRASILTGTTPHRHGVWNNFTPWSDDNRTFFEYLSRAGYDTAFIGKWHMPGGLPELRGVDHFVTFTHLGGQGTYEDCPLVVDGRPEPSRTRYITTELTDRALAWLEARSGRPFALFLSHKSVHADFTPDAEERGRYASASVTLPPGSHPWSHLLGAQYTHLAFRPLPTLVRRYAESIVSMDREIGRILAFLDARGASESTLLVYTSDNGYLWGEHGLVDKRWAWEESIRVPLLVRHPAGALAPGSRREQLVANVDLAPTLLELAGFEPPAYMQGRSLVPVLRDAAARHRSELPYRYFFEPPYPTPSVRGYSTFGRTRTSATPS